MIDNHHPECDRLRRPLDDLLCTCLSLQRRDLRQRAERAEARVAELAEQIQDIVDLIETETSGSCDEDLAHLCLGWLRRLDGLIRRGEHAENRPDSAPNERKPR